MPPARVIANVISVVATGRLMKGVEMLMCPPGFLDFLGIRGFREQRVGFGGSLEPGHKPRDATEP